MSKIQIGRGAVFLYIESISSMLLGYAFWFILSRTTSADIIGVLSSLISLATIFASIAGVGIPIGSQRFLGKLFLEREIVDAKVIVMASLIIVVVGIIICSSVILAFGGIIFIEYEYILIVLSVILIAFSTLSILFRHVIIATLETKKLSIISIVSAGFKLFLTTILVSVGAGVFEIMVAFTSMPILTTLIFAISVFSLLRQTQSQQKSSVKLIHSFKLLLSASVVNWIPSFIDAIGSQMGTIIVLGIQGSAQAGFYFIAFQITVGISAAIWALQGVTYPALSTMQETRKLFLWRVIKISLIIVLPLSNSMIFYSKDVMHIFGYEYGEASDSLEILLLSILPVAVTAGLTILEYSYGNYKYVLFIGLSTSIPRLVFYFILIPWYGEAGAATSYTIGSVIGFIVSIYLARRFNLTLAWRDLGLIFVIPLIFAFIISNLHIHFIISLILSVVVSYLFLLKFGMINRNDVQDSLTIFPVNLSNPLIRTINAIASKLNKRY